MCEIVEKLEHYVFLIGDEELREGVKKYIEYKGEELFRSPASRRHHHAYEGGLVNHIIQVCEIGRHIIQAFGLNVNLDYYLVSAILHDMGKVGKYRWDGEEKTWVHNTENMYSRIDDSYDAILNFTRVTGVILPKEIQLAILSHMGGWSTTGVYPDTLLSAVLHSADLISSRLERGGK